MKKLLVTGYMRSGSTFLANILNSQKNIRVYRDFLNCLFRESLQLGVEDYLTPMTDRQKYILLSRLKSEAHHMKQHFFDNLKPDYNNLRELYYNALESMILDENCKVIGTKVTAVGDWLNHILNETDVYVIYLFRDIRDILLSSRNFFVNYNTIKFIYNIKNDVEKAMDIYNPKLFKLRFEDLIYQPHYWLGELSRLLEVDINPIYNDTLDIDTRGWIDNSSFHDINQLFDKGACYRWKKEPDSVEVKYSEILVGDLLSKLGYDITFNGYKLSDKVIAYLKYLRCSLLHNQNVNSLKDRFLVKWK